MPNLSQVLIDLKSPRQGGGAYSTLRSPPAMKKCNIVGRHPVPAEGEAQGQQAAPAACRSIHTAALAAAAAAAAVQIHAKFDGGKIRRRIE